MGRLFGPLRLTIGFHGAGPARVPPPPPPPPFPPPSLPSPPRSSIVCAQPHHPRRRALVQLDDIRARTQEIAERAESQGLSLNNGSIRFICALTAELCSQSTSSFSKPIRRRASAVRWRRPAGRAASGSLGLAAWPRRPASAWPRPPRPGPARAPEPRQRVVDDEVVAGGRERRLDAPATPMPPRTGQAACSAGPTGCSRNHRPRSPGGSGRAAGTCPRPRGRRTGFGAVLP